MVQIYVYVFLKIADLGSLCKMEHFVSKLGRLLLFEGISCTCYFTTGSKYYCVTCQFNLSQQRISGILSKVILQIFMCTHIHAFMHAHMHACTHTNFSEKNFQKNFCACMHACGFGGRGSASQGS